MDKYTQFLKSSSLLFLLLVAWLHPIILIPIAIIALLAALLFNRAYKKGAYYQVTKNSYLATRFDIGKYGEYLTYKRLKHFEKNGGKFLFNLYIPKEGEETTEIDVLLLCPKGVFVFESKNYSGWIFGSESQKQWTQSLPQGRKRSHKEHFYNPIWQNKTHIKHLKHLIGEDTPVRSIIVFSERCTLKNVTVQSPDIRVINRYDIAPVVSEICSQIHADLLDAAAITDIYNKLYPYTQVSDATKAQHIANIEEKRGASGASNGKEAAEKTVVAPVEETVVETVTPMEKTVAEDKSADTAIETTAPLKCPRCGGNLILRTAKRGPNAGKQFYGCEGYPKCRYVGEMEK